MSDIDELEAKAKNATPGPWRSSWADDTYEPDERSTGDEWLIKSGETNVIAQMYLDGTHLACTEEDAAFIASANPAAILDLIRRVREAEARAEVAEGERDYMAGYQADLAAVDRCLDAIDAPHHPEDGVSLSTRRIRELGGVLHGLRTERDAALAALEAMRVDRDARPAITREQAHTCIEFWDDTTTLDDGTREIRLPAEWAPIMYALREHGKAGG